ncbi:Sodium/hydrogen exchanger [Ascobolus immersus RN42]|uniref:Sodium/hydrogen exchanger n=1 Tax=Ascobolus immersus RN42 TaxID=1160509 RepID=A0A3N4I9E2_ASCIM|nr:Sodium/hydrogen exchanger [Ascobolus immersus RN42]
MAAPFLTYHEPTTNQILILLSFLAFLPLSHFVASKIFRAGLIGQIILGIIYGVPLANILLHQWQETILALGYLGLIIIVFEGGLTTRLDLLKKCFGISVICALTGLLTPIALSIALLSAGFGYEIKESFAIGAALSSTSLGTTFGVIQEADVGNGKGGMVDTRVGTVLVSAALIDDVVGLVMAKVIAELGGDGADLGWTIGRPVLVAFCLSAITPFFVRGTRLVLPFLRPTWKKFTWAQRNRTTVNFATLVVTLAAFSAVAAYAGTSILLGAYLAGCYLNSLSRKPSDTNMVINNEPKAETYSSSAENETELKGSTYVQTFTETVGDVHEHILSAFFFASIGFAVPFLDLWTGKAIWRGIVYSILMIFSKLLVGIWLPVIDIFASPKSASTIPTTESLSTPVTEIPGSTSRLARISWAPALILGLAMVARGEIGLLIIQLAYNQSGIVSEEGFVTGIWAILLNTIIGPMAVGLYIKLKSRKGKTLSLGQWR